jgi:Bacterial extracellular solute-binding protein
VEGALFPGAGKAETPAASPGTEKDTPIIVFAAASTKTALDAVAAAWKTNAGKTALIAYASSGILAKQIEQRGARRYIHFRRSITSRRPSSSAPEHAGNFLATSLF